MRARHRRDWDEKPVAANAYKRLIRSAQHRLHGKLAPANLTAPLIMAKPRNWDRSKQRVLFVGQETMEWGSDRFPFRGSLKEASLPGSLNQLARAYCNFDLGRRPAMRSPFWQAIGYARDQADDTSSSFLWTNIVTVAYDGLNRRSMSMFWNLTWAEAETVAHWQRGRLTEEIAELQPTAVIFLSGPRYDF